MSSSKQANAIADVEQGIVLATVEIAAAPERVFEALFNPEDVTRWWGADGAYRTTEWEADVRPGGKWRAAGAMSDGRAFAVAGEFIDVDAPRKVVFTWRPDWDAPNETLVTYMLEPLHQGTRLTLRHEGFWNRSVVCRAHREGWERILGWLAADLRPQAAPAKYFLYKLIPPRPTFIHDASAEELALMRAHGVYWRAKLAEGNAIAVGPVAEPGGAWGLGVLRAADADEARGLASNDPVVVADKGFQFQVFPMPNVIHQ